MGRGAGAAVVCGAGFGAGFADGFSVLEVDRRGWSVAVAVGALLVLTTGATVGVAGAGAGVGAAVAGASVDCTAFTWLAAAAGPSDE